MKERTAHSQLLLLLAAGGVFYLGLVLLASYQARALAWYWQLAWAPVAFCLAWWLLRRFVPGADSAILVPLAWISLLGLTIIARISLHYALLQQLWLTLGLVCAVAVAYFLEHPSRLGALKYTLGLAAVLLIGLSFFGVESGGARLWLKLGGLSFQPEEPAKVFLVLFLAAYLAQAGPLLSGKGGLPFGVRLKYVLPVVAFAVLALALFVRLNDLGAAALFMGLFLAMSYVATGDLKLVGLGLALFVGGATLAALHFHHVQTRLLAFWAPWKYYQAEGYQIAQALMSLGQGRLLGVGLGAGLGAKSLGTNTLLPNALTDMPFPILCEELGAVAGLGLIWLFALVVARLGWKALELRLPFARLAVFGFAALLGLQAFVILAGVLKVLPLTGITTPFFSYGGSSLVTNFTLIGLYLAFTREGGRNAA